MSDAKKCVMSQKNCAYCTGKIENVVVGSGVCFTQEEFCSETCARWMHARRCPQCGVEGLFEDFCSERCEAWSWLWKGRCMRDRKPGQAPSRERWEEFCHSYYGMTGVIPAYESMV